MVKADKIKKLEDEIRYCKYRMSNNNVSYEELDELEYRWSEAAEELKELQ